MMEIVIYSSLPRSILHAHRRPLVGLPSDGANASTLWRPHLTQVVYMKIPPQGLHQMTRLASMIALTVLK